MAVPLTKKFRPVTDLRGQRIGGRALPSGLAVKMTGMLAQIDPNQRDVRMMAPQKKNTLQRDPRVG
jgi:hypothetical protein